MTTLETTVESPSDWELLESYVAQGSETAFAMLVQRHINLVYAVALRQCSDPLLAQEISSEVFITLAGKARTLKREVAIPGWLFKAARYIASNARAFQSRRRKWEQEGAALEIASRQGAAANESELAKAWELIAEELDLAVAALSHGDRNAILLRFYESKSLREIGLEFAISEEAARKRTTRALEKLRKSMLARGVVCPSAMLALALSTYSAQSAPSGITEAVCQAALQWPSHLTPIPEHILAGMNRKPRWSLAKAAGLSFLTVALLYNAARLFSNGPGPREVFIGQMEAVRAGDGEAYAQTLYFQTPEEQKTRPIFVESIRLRFQLRTSLVRRFGSAAFEQSAFPRFLDILDPNSIAHIKQTIVGDQGTVLLPWGPRVPFVKQAGQWKVAYFSLPNAVSPERHIIDSTRRNKIIELATREVDAGSYPDIQRAYNSIQERWRQVPR